MSKRGSGRPKTSVVWNYFEFIADANCSECIVVGPQGVCGKRISGRNSTNLKAHLRSIHKATYSELEDKDAALGLIISSRNPVPNNQSLNDDCGSGVIGLRTFASHPNACSSQAEYQSVRPTQIVPPKRSLPRGKKSAKALKLEVDASDNEEQQMQNEIQLGIGSDLKGHMDHVIKTIRYIEEEARFRKSFIMTPHQSLLLMGNAALGQRIKAYLKLAGVTVLRRELQHTETDELEKTFLLSAGWIPCVILLDGLDLAGEASIMFLRTQLIDMRERKIPNLVVATAVNLEDIYEETRALFEEVVLREVEDPR